MARKKLAEPLLTSYLQVDANLARIAQLQRDIQLETDACNESVDQMKKASQDKIKPLNDELKKCELLIKEYCEHNRTDFVAVKTKTLTHGSVGYRLSTSVSIPDPLFTVQACQRLGLTNCFRTTMTPDKENIKQLEPDVITEIGAIIKSGDKFGYEIAVVDPAKTGQTA